MRRLFLVLTVAALMTAMMVSPAWAQNVNTGRTGDIENDFAVIQNNSRVGDIDFDDDIGDFDDDDGIDIDFDDDDDIGDFGILGLFDFDDDDGIDFDDDDIGDFDNDGTIIRIG